MVSALVLGVGLLAAAPAASPSPDLSAYEHARDKVGRDPVGHVRLSLWCEAHGLSAERVRHLALAVLGDPRNATARGLLGLVHYRGRWERPEAVSARVKADAALSAKLAGYRARRAAADETADDHWTLALWCEENGLAAEARAHLTAVTRLAPERPEPWERLGFVRGRGRWLTRAQADAEAAQVLADARWRPLVEGWRAGFSAKDPALLDRARSGLGGVTDPSAVPELLRSTARAGADWQLAVVGVLAKVASAQSTRALADLAVDGKTPEVRADAAEALRGREPLDCADRLVARLREPLSFSYHAVKGPGTTGELRIEDGGLVEQRLYVAPAMPAIPGPEGPADGYVADLFGRPVLRHVGAAFRFQGPGVVGTAVRVTEIPVGQMVERALRSAREVSLRQQRDVKALKRENEEAVEENGRAVAALREISGQDFGTASILPWRAWGAEQQGFQPDPPPYVRPPVVVKTVRPKRRPRLAPATYEEVTMARCCFAGETPVHTLTGPLRIDAVRVGDQVLAQDPATGALSFRPVVAVRHNPPDQTSRIVLDDGDGVVCTGLHRFWKAGTGWVMARDLKPGDALRTAGGSARVAAVDGDSVRPVFNIEVEGGHGLFVGEAGVLAHDNSPMRPVPAPFDAPPGSATAALRKADAPGNGPRPGQPTAPLQSAAVRR